MSLRDDSSATAVSSDFKDILSIEGENFADFKYETFDAAEMDSKTGVNSEVALRAASVRIHFVEKALRSLYVFVIKLATLKSLYDAAAQAAVQSASEIQRMRFDISVKSPIIVFPTDAAKSTDCLTMRLGELSAKNAYDGDESRMAASLHGLQLASSLAAQSTLKMIDEINIDSNIIVTSSIDRSVERARPDTQVRTLGHRMRSYLSYELPQVEVKISDVKLHLAQAQYVVLLTLAQTIPGIFAPVASLSVEDAQRLSPAVQTARPPPSSELHTSGSSSPWTTVDLVVRMNTIKLHLYDSQADTEETLQEHGIARFAINGSTLRFKMLNSGASEAELVMKSFTMSNTRPGKTAFREIIPAARHDRNQLMVLFKMSGPVENSAVAEVSIDAPSLIFAMDPVFALTAFFTSMPPTASPQALPASDSIETAGVQSPSTFHLSFSVDIQDLDVNVLEDDTKQDTSAISLSIKRIIVSQQVSHRPGRPAGANYGCRTFWPSTCRSWECRCCRWGTPPTASVSSTRRTSPSQWTIAVYPGTTS
jgi:vacuolar protein sorting-associated protein 13A/C